MPALRAFGRRWRLASDTAPIPAALSFAFSTFWVALLLLLGGIGGWPNKCSEGQDWAYVLLFSLFLASFALGAVLDLLVLLAGCRGSPLESSKRRAVAPLLEVMVCVVWPLHLAATVYGTVAVFAFQPTCWAQELRGHVRALAMVLVWTAWGTWGTTMVLLAAVYDPYHEYRQVEVWADCWRMLARLLGCIKALEKAPDSRQHQRPIQSIAELSVGMLAHTDLDATDLTASIILVARAQALRRRLAILRALGPASGVHSLALSHPEQQQPRTRAERLPGGGGGRAWSDDYLQRQRRQQYPGATSHAPFLGNSASGWAASRRHMPLLPQVVSRPVQDLCGGGGASSGSSGGGWDRGGKYVPPLVQDVEANGDSGGDSGGRGGGGPSMSAAGPTASSGQSLEASSSAAGPDVPPSQQQRRQQQRAGSPSVAAAQAAETAVWPGAALPATASLVRARSEWWEELGIDRSLEDQQPLAMVGKEEGDTAQASAAGPATEATRRSSGERGSQEGMEELAKGPSLLIQEEEEERGGLALHLGGRRWQRKRQRGQQQERGETAAPSTTAAATGRGWRQAMLRSSSSMRAGRQRGWRQQHTHQQQEATCSRGRDAAAVAVEEGRSPLKQQPALAGEVRPDSMPHQEEEKAVGEGTFTSPFASAADVPLHATSGRGGGSGDGSNSPGDGSGKGMVSAFAAAGASEGPLDEAADGGGSPRSRVRLQGHASLDEEHSLLQLDLPSTSSRALPLFFKPKQAAPPAAPAPLLPAGSNASPAAIATALAMAASGSSGGGGSGSLSISPPLKKGAWAQEGGEAGSASALRAAAFSLMALIPEDAHALQEQQGGQGGPDMQQGQQQQREGAGFGPGQGPRRSSSGPSTMSIPGGCPTNRRSSEDGGRPRMEQSSVRVSGRSRASVAANEGGRLSQHSKLLTPSGHISPMALPRQLADFYAGSHHPVAPDVLEEVRHYLGFALAVYALDPQALHKKKQREQQEGDGRLPGDPGDSFQELQDMFSNSCGAPPCPPPALSSSSSSSSSSSCAPPPPPPVPPTNPVGGVRRQGSTGMGDLLGSSGSAASGGGGSWPRMGRSAEMKSAEEVLHKSVYDLAGLRSGDLLHYSVSNEEVGHLPYMLLLDRKRKSVVLSIRGTQSLVDLVTDAVVHPFPIDTWLPAQVKETIRGPSYAHLGMVMAAEAILNDLESHGILQQLLTPEQRPRDVPSPQEAVSAGAAGVPGSAGGVSGEDVGGSGGSASAGVGPEESISATKAIGEQEGASRSADPREKGGALGRAVREAVQGGGKGGGWRLVVLGHSLGAGAAALISLKLRSAYPNLRCFAFCPPGGLLTRRLSEAMAEWTTSIVVGKDVVPRTSVANLRRLMDEMVTALARCRLHKLQVLSQGWRGQWHGAGMRRLFHGYDRIPDEARHTLARYFESIEAQGRPLPLYPPARVVFFRPIKDASRGAKEWDAVWVKPKEIIDEGILISGRMYQDHLGATLADAIDCVLLRGGAPTGRTRSLPSGAGNGGGDVGGQARGSAGSGSWQAPSGGGTNGDRTSGGGGLADGEAPGPAAAAGGGQGGTAVQRLAEQGVLLENA